ncbi:TlpA disulfide reductase family protein [Phocaeicola barnesiae]|uniref:TlpA disulfide reductase family protein n=1 Tax=Phocaeicola barnesiae TaxID=376804 RepID=UPI00241BF51E|nr:TlpA disulfide reductase family protein [Phocaeicola barnesiae]
MKNFRKFGTMLIGVCSMISCTSNPNGFIIEGDVEGLPDGTVVQLYPVCHESSSPIATDTLQDGKFLFEGQVEEPLAARLIVKDGYGSTSLMLSKGKQTLTGQITSQKQENNVSYDFQQVDLSGSELTDRYRSLMEVRNKLDSIYNEKSKRYEQIYAAVNAARQKQNQTLIDSLLQCAEYKEAVRADSLFFVKVKDSYHKVIMDNKDSFWGPLMLISLTTYLTEADSTWYKEFSQEAQNSYYGKMVKNEIWPAEKKGLQAPDFQVTASNGEQTSLKELSANKKYILIDFWASWCKPCRKEIPNLKKLYELYAAKGFQIISISIDKKEKEWQKALDEEQLSWPNFLDNGEVASLYKVKFIPTMYLIDEQGTIVCENLKGEELSNKLAELFK